ALRLDSGVPFHVKLAKQAGASRDEVISALLVGLPAAGNGVTQSLPAAFEAPTGVAADRLRRVRPPHHGGETPARHSATRYGVGATRHDERRTVAPDL